MMDELERLKDALKDRAAALPRPEARRAAIGAALEAFDAKHVPARQGSGIAARLIGAAHAAFETLTGRRPMRMTHALAGGASLIVLTLAVMTTAGLYESSGDWLYDVGLPGKSGIGGGIITVAPGKGGLATFAPPLDRAGNSVRGQLAARLLSRALGLDIFMSRTERLEAPGRLPRRPPVNRQSRDPPAKGSP